jgi:hypothetical protein
MIYRQSLLAAYSHTHGRPQRAHNTHNAMQHQQPWRENGQPMGKRKSAASLLSLHAVSTQSIKGLSRLLLSANANDARYAHIYTIEREMKNTFLCLLFY